MGGLSGLGSAPLHGSLHRQLWSHFILRRLRVVPYGLPGYRRLRRAPPQHHCSPGRSHSPGPARHLGRLRQAQGNTPCAPRGGLCGLLAARQTFQKPPGVPTGWGSLQGQNLPVGPPLGALRCRFRGALAPRSRPPTALWGIQEGKADVTRCETGARRTSSAATRASCPPSSDLVNSSALKHGRLAFTGAR